MALFLQHRSLLSPPQLPRPTAVNTLQAHGEQLLLPGRVQKWAPRVSHRASWPGILTWWMGWGVGRQKLPQALSALPCGRFLPQRPACPRGESYRLSGPLESSPHRRRSFPCERCLALLTTVPNPCQQHFKLWPAQCYILTGQALLA